MAMDANGKRISNVAGTKDYDPSQLSDTEFQTWQQRRRDFASNLVRGPAHMSQEQANQFAYKNVRNPVKPLEFLQRTMGYEAKQFRKHLGDYKEERYKGLLPAYDEAKKEGYKNINEDASRRGLLYSGIRAGKQSKFQSGLESNLAESKFNINKESEQMARQKELAAAQVGLQNAAMLQQNMESYYNTQMQNDLMRRQAFGNLASGLGSAAGAYYGGKK